MRTRILAHDTLPLQLRTSHYSAAVASAFEAYYRSFADADAVLTTTRIVAAEVRGFLAGEGHRIPPSTPCLFRRSLPTCLAFSQLCHACVGRESR